ncbi:MAG: L-threonylcarbamoyladenylate synthase [Pyrinomonadaceae bacterium]
MNTLLTTSVEEAVSVIRGGGVAAFPTETVYGLGANIFDEWAVGRIFEAKQRPADNPLIAHIADADQIDQLAAHIPSSAHALIDEFFPGPLTIVLKKTDSVPLIATAGLDTIGIRMPSLDLAHQLIKKCGTPIVAPSANLSGRPSPTTWQAVYEDLDGRIDCILQSDPTDIGLESTVVDCTGDGPPTLLRLGAVSIDELRAIVPEIRTHTIGESDARKSPGLRHRHYSPTAAVVLVDSRDPLPFTSNDAAYIGLHAPTAGPSRRLVCHTVAEYAHSLFEFFRECDRGGVTTIFCERVDESGMGAALMDRLRRAAKDE